MILRWFLSKTVRHAVAMRKHVHRILCAQRDILSPQAVTAVNASLAELQKAVRTGADKPALLKQVESLEATANKWLKPYPNASWRENVEVLLVALVVAMGIRTFFLQPFKIPTGSMQPTLYGVTSTPNFARDLAAQSDFEARQNELRASDRARWQAQIQAEFNQESKSQQAIGIPGRWERIKQWFHGVSYVHFVAPEDGSVEGVTKPWPPAFFSIYQSIKFAGQWHRLWFPPDYGESPLEARAGLTRGRVFHRGEDVVKLEVHAGDRLFVDRLTYNFRPPQRGEIVVFQTAGIPEERRDNYDPPWHIPPDQFYIKRLVALGGERVQIGDDRHLIINGHRLDASTPHFENVYSFDPKKPPQESRYSGHVDAGMAPFFKDKPDGVLVPSGDYMVMGDNTMSSLDSRFWGPFPATAVIGKSFFVYWPITSRFGWGQH